MLFPVRKDHPNATKEAHHFAYIRFYADPKIHPRSRNVRYEAQPRLPFNQSNIIAAGLNSADGDHDR